MKRVLALLLAVLMLGSLLACAKTPSGNNGGTANNGSGGNKGSGSQVLDEFKDAADNYEEGKDYSDATGNAGDKADGNFVEGNDIIGNGSGDGTGEVKFENNNDLINPAFAGKTLQIYGWSSAVFDDIEEMGKGSFVWMMRAAVDEWAAMNNVTIVYEGDFDQNAIIGAISSGEKPDLLLHSTKMPIAATSGILRPLTDAEYAQLADTCGSIYLDVMNYKGKSYGFNYPWSGNSLFYYNKTVFEKYGVKTPKEYYMEDNWTWDTMEKCFDELQAKLNADGSKDFCTSTTNNLAFPYKLKENNDGTLTNNIMSDEFRRAYEIQYRGLTETGTHSSTYTLSRVSTSPRAITHVGDAEWYNFEHINQTLDNGDILETIYVPVYSYDQPRVTQYSQAFSGIMSSCDEPEATLALMTYILRVGLRYMSDFSLGLYECNYEGMRGASVYSKGWKENFEQILDDRQETFDAIEDWDEEMYQKLIKDLSTSTGYLGRFFAGEPSPKYGQDPLPPATHLATLSEEYAAWITTYNELYAN